MTNEQREKIITLRHQNFGYTAIANSVGLSKDSVKAYCRSHGLAGEKAKSHSLAEVPTQLCLNCGKPLIQLPGKKQKKFCCPECRTTWWNAHPEAVKQKAVYAFTCSECGKKFTAYGKQLQKASSLRYLRFADALMCQSISDAGIFLQLDNTEDNPEYASKNCSQGLNLHASQHG